MMKARIIAIVDYDIKGGFRKAAEEEAKMERVIEDAVKDNPRVIHHEFQMMERGMKK